MGIKLIKISVIYFVIGTLLGMYISITEDLTLSSVHSHISCLGWTALVLSGFIYHLFPELGNNILSKIQFWLFNIGLPLTIIGLSFYLYDKSEFKTVVAVGATLFSIGIILFAINVLTGIKK